MNARLTKFALRTSLLLFAGLALLFSASQALSPSGALAETPPPPPGLPSLPGLPSDPAAAPAPAAPTTPAPAAPAAPTTSPAPTTTTATKAKKQVKHKCKHGKRCAKKGSKRGRPGTQGETTASTSAVVGGVTAGSVGYFSTCYHAVYGVSYTMSSLQGSGVLALPMMYDWATSRWTWPQYWTPANGITNWALTAYRPYEYVKMWYARQVNGVWQYNAEWIYAEPDLDNGFCS